MPSPRSLEAQIADLIDRVARLERQVDLRRKRNQQARLMLATGGVKIDANRGLAANFHKELDPPSQEYPAGWNILAQRFPATGYQSIIPVNWTLPASVGNLDPLLVFVMSDLSVVTRFATGGANESHAADLEFNKDGLTVVWIEFVVNNVGGAPETGDVGLFKIDGWQV